MATPIISSRKINNANKNYVLNNFVTLILKKNFNNRLGGMFFCLLVLPTFYFILFYLFFWVVQDVQCTLWFANVMFTCLHRCDRWGIQPYNLWSQAAVSSIISHVENNNLSKKKLWNDIKNTNVQFSTEHLPHFPLLCAKNYLHWEVQYRYLNCLHDFYIYFSLAVFVFKCTVIK